MLIHDILGIDPGEIVYFVEDSYSALKNNNQSLQYLEIIQKAELAPIIAPTQTYKNPQ